MSQTHKSECQLDSDMETWSELKARHVIEEQALLQSWADTRITQTVAAAAMGLSLQKLNYLIVRHAVWWPVKQQGVRTRQADFRPVQSDDHSSLVDQQSSAGGARNSKTASEATLS